MQDASSNRADDYGRGVDNGSQHSSVFLVTHFLKSLHDGCWPMVVESTERILSFQFGCPVEHAFAVTLGVVFGSFQQFSHKGLTLFRALSLDASLHYHQLAAIFLVQSFNVSNDLRKRLVFALRELVLHVPVGIDAHADHVPMGTVLA